MKSAILRKAQPLRFPHKQLRSKVIADYVRAAGYRGVVVFTCGNAAAALRERGLEVVEIGPRGDLKTEKWWTQAEIHRGWPDLFDATSGHLAVPLMGDIAKAFRAHLGELPAGRYSVPSGSGETVACLRVAYPLLRFDATYDNSKPETTRHEDAPLNGFIDGEEETDEEKKQQARMMANYGELVISMPTGSGTSNRRGPLFALSVLAVVAAISSVITLLIVR